MKFRAEMADSQCMRELFNMVAMLTKLARSCVMNISKERVYFIANEESGSVAPLVWMDIDVQLFFGTFNMESAQSKYPNIVLSLSTANLGRAFAQMRTHTARRIKFKLTNLQFPCLSIELDVISPNTDSSRKVAHDVPVTVIPRSDWCYYELPQIPKCQIVLKMLMNRKMRGIIERIKNIAPTIIFFATSNGELNLVSETESATVTTRCAHLDIVKLNKQRSTPDCIVESSCAVDSKKVSLLASALQMPTAEIAIGLDDERLMHWHVHVRSGVAIHAILPAVAFN